MLLIFPLRVRISSATPIKAERKKYEKETEKYYSSLEKLLNMSAKKKEPQLQEVLTPARTLPPPSPPPSLPPLQKRNMQRWKRAFCLVCHSCFYFCVFGRRTVRLSIDVPRSGAFPGLPGEEMWTHSRCLAPRSDVAAVPRGGEIQRCAANTRAFRVKQINKQAAGIVPLLWGSAICFAHLRGEDPPSRGGHCRGPPSAPSDSRLCSTGADLNK